MGKHLIYSEDRIVLYDEDADISTPIILVDDDTKKLTFSNSVSVKSDEVLSFGDNDEASMSYSSDDAKMVISGTWDLTGSILSYDDLTDVPATFPPRVEAGTVRPTTDLVTGQVFFDTNLATPKPIWYDGAVWVDSTGTAV